MQRLVIAREYLRAFMTDMHTLPSLQPNEVSALATVRETLALIQEAELYMAHGEPVSDATVRALEKLSA